MWSEDTFHVIKNFKCVGVCFMAQRVLSWYVSHRPLEKNVYRCWWIHILQMFYSAEGLHNIYFPECLLYKLLRIRYWSLQLYNPVFG